MNRSVVACSTASILAALPGLTASAQTPPVATRVLCASGNAGGSPQLPSGLAVAKLVMFDADHALAGDQPNRCYLADGTTVQQVMIAGAQVPGQPAGVTWRGLSDFGIRPLTAGGSWFYASTAGQASDYFAGRLDGSPLLLAPQSLGRPNPAGLRLRIAPDIGAVVNDIRGADVTVIPPGFVPPGRSLPGTLSTQQAGDVNGLGQVAVRCSSAQEGYSDLLIADAGSIRVVLASGSIVQTDRGPATVTNVQSPSSQPVAEGAAFAFVDLIGSDGIPTSALVLAGGPGPLRIVAAIGDPAPGAGHGVEFQSVSHLAANRRGSLLFVASLTGPGVTSGNDLALYLWRQGRSQLISREAPGRSIPAPSLQEAIALNDRDEVGFLTSSRVVLYSPAAGTVEVARVGSPLPDSTGISFNVRELKPFYGNNGELLCSGGDESRISLLSPDGRFFFTGSTQDPATRAGSQFAMTVQITGPGCPADFNSDGFVDFFDYADFVECFEGGRCPDGRSDDFNHDDFADFFDYLDFVQAFEVGC